MADFIHTKAYKKYRTGPLKKSDRFNPLFGLDKGRYLETAFRGKFV